MLHIVDDEKSVRRALTLVAKSANFESDNFAGAAEFLKSAEIVENDILILDIHMPGLNGFDLLRVLSAMNKKLNVIVLTAHDNEDNRELAQKYGVKAFFRKPCDSQALIDMINFLKTSN